MKKFSAIGVGLVFLSSSIAIADGQEVARDIVGGSIGFVGGTAGGMAAGCGLGVVAALPFAVTQNVKGRGDQLVKTGCQMGAKIGGVAGGLGGATALIMAAEAPSEDQLQPAGELADNLIHE